MRQKNAREAQLEQKLRNTEAAIALIKNAVADLSRASEQHAGYRIEVDRLARIVWDTTRAVGREYKG